MVEHETNPGPDGEASAPPLAPSQDAGPPAVPVRGRRFWPAVLAAGLIGGALGWLGGEAVVGLFALPDELNSRAAAMNASQDDMREAELFRLKVETENAALALGLVGAALGLTLALAGGFVGRRPKRGLACSVIGLVVGGAVGAGVVLVLQPVLRGWQTENPDDLIHALLLHGVLTAAVGGAGGLAFGLGLGERGWTLRALIGGLIGAALVTLVFQMIAGAVIPIGKPDYLVPTTSSTRLFARLVLGLGTALGVGLSRPAAPRPVADAPIVPDPTPIS